MLAEAFFPAESAKDDLRPAACTAALIAILLAAAAIRVDNLGWGHPGFLFPDTVRNHLRPAAALVGAGDVFLSPSPLVHPPLLPYCLGALLWVTSLITGEPVLVEGKAADAQLAWIDMLGRGLTVFFALLSLLVLFGLARPLLGGRTALLATAVFALSPIHVLESHRTTPDVLMVLVMLASAERALAAARLRSCRTLLLSFALAGLAGAAKYPGVSAVVLPACVTVLWPGRDGRSRLAWLAGGGLAAAAGLVAGLGPTILQPKRYADALYVLSLTGTVTGMQGTDIHARGWQFARFVYPATIMFPYMMGWAAYACSLAGLVVLVRSHRRALFVVAVAIGPFFLAQGMGLVIVPRYFLPLVPFLALCAAVALRRAWRLAPLAGAGLCAVVLAYTAVLDWSFCRQMALLPQEEVGAFLARRIEGRADPARPLVVAYPDIFIYAYDAVIPHLQRPEIRVVHAPQIYWNVRREPAEPPVEAEEIARDRRWIDEFGVDVIVVPSWVKDAVLREKPDGYAGGFYRRLSDGSLGFRLAAAPSTHFFTERLYTWGDPILRSHMDNGIQSYEIYTRAEEQAHAGR